MGVCPGIPAAPAQFSYLLQGIYLSYTHKVNRLRPGYGSFFAAKPLLSFLSISWAGRVSQGLVAWFDSPPTKSFALP
jgi:hypothetical protein